MGKRQESREQIEGRIVELGRRHLVDRGAAGLSLRAIARDLGMVSSAVYRYVSSRDELLTLLLVDAYSNLADAVDRARDTADDLRASGLDARDHQAPQSSRARGLDRTLARRPVAPVPNSRRAIERGLALGRELPPLLGRKF